MAENYCGRSCESCDLQAEINCPGCQEGPGKKVLDLCEVASCCRIKKQSSCDDCIEKDNCEKLQAHENTPDYIRNNLSLEMSKIKHIKDRSKYAGEFNKLFILGIISIAANFLSNESISEVFPLFSAIGGIAEIVCSIIVVISLLNLGKLIEEYKISAYCSIASVAIGIVSLIVSIILIFTNSSVGTAFAIIFALVTVGVSLFATYKKYRGHCEILSGIDDELAEKWEVLWNWYILSLGGTIFGLLLIMISLFLGAIFILACAIALIVVLVLELKYLKKMYELFEDLEFKYKDVIIED